MNFVKDAWDIFWDAIGFFYFITVIDEWEEGIVLQLGRFRRTLKPGWRWHLPFMLDEITVMNVKPTALELAEQSVTTVDNVEVVCRGVLMWGIFDIRKATCDVEDAEETLGDIAVGVIMESIEESEWDYVRSPDFRKDVKKAIQRQARKWGITVSTVKFQDLVKAQSHRVFGGLA